MTIAYTDLLQPKVGFSSKFNSIVVEILMLRVSFCSLIAFDMLLH